MDKQQIIKEIILALHKGLPVQAAKQRFEQEIGEISASEIAAIEQALIDDGMSPDEIKKFCNVHALLFESALSKTAAQVESPAHPVNLFKAENRQIEAITNSIRDMVQGNLQKYPEELKGQLEKLKGIDIHYMRKEQLLFPFLEKYGFMGPSKVMWGKDNEIRGLLKDALAGAENINLLLEEVNGMIFKEENILFPAALEKLVPNDWVEILKGSEEVGYVFIEKPQATSLMIEELENILVVAPEIKPGGIIAFPTGNLQVKELLQILNVLPLDITFVDKNDEVKYFSAGKDRVFVRTKAVIGRKVQNCHPPQSLDRVEEILDSFKAGRSDSAGFWLNFKARMVYIRYFAVRDENRNYLGALEVTQDITEIKSLQGEKRLLDEKAKP